MSAQPDAASERPKNLAKLPHELAIDEIIQGLDLASDNETYEARQRYLEEIFKRSGVLMIQEERDGFALLIREISALATNDDGVDPEAWWIELDADTAAMLRSVAVNSAKLYPTPDNAAPSIIKALNAHARLLAETAQKDEEIKALRKALRELLTDAELTWEVMQFKDPTLKHVKEPTANTNARAALSSKEGQKAKDGGNQ